MFPYHILRLYHHHPRSKRTVKGCQCVCVPHILNMLTDQLWLYPLWPQVIYSSQASRRSPSDPLFLIGFGPETNSIALCGGGLTTTPINYGYTLIQRAFLLASSQVPAKTGSRISASSRSPLLTLSLGNSQTMTPRKGGSTSRSTRTRLSAR